MGCCASKDACGSDEDIGASEQLNRTATTYATLMGADEVTDLLVVDANGQSLYSWEPLGQSGGKQAIIKDYITTVGTSTSGYVVTSSTAVCIHLITAESGPQVYIILSLKCTSNSKLQNMNPLRVSEDTSHLVDELRDIIHKCRLIRKGSTQASSKSEKGW
eukprot:TRINITY_DN4111_c0_g1_i1.p1 TRINITY_DN4111_c0_g1~~TRINITY_DN4111_c0_g1_i1.p1  ORF type:complete len:161 (+),score=21.74 TRINITY_DN4111_c0_g1_i1:119-601(+)